MLGRLWGGRNRKEEDMCGCGLRKERELWWLEVDSTEIFSVLKA